MNTTQNDFQETQKTQKQQETPVVLDKNHMEIERKWLVHGWPEDRAARKTAAEPAALVKEEKALQQEQAALAHDQEILPLLKEEFMLQGYVSVDPTVRIREEKVTISNDPAILLMDNFMLCFKSHGTLSRKEIEFPIGAEHFHELEDLIGLPLIPKTRRTYRLAGGLFLEVNHVDEGQPTEFWYAEIEFPSEAAAHRYDPSGDGLADFLVNDVTSQPGQTMGAYWTRTRLKKQANWQLNGYA